MKMEGLKTSGSFLFLLQHGWQELSNLQVRHFPISGQRIECAGQPEGMTSRAMARGHLCSFPHLKSPGSLTVFCFNILAWEFSNYTL